MEIAGVADRTESAVGSKEEPTWSEDGTVPVVLDDTMTRPGVENGFPRGQTREGGSLTIAPASAAREIPGWPESVLEATPAVNLGMLKFPGLISERRYRVEIIDRPALKGVLQVPWMAGAPLELTGAQLMGAGLRAPVLRPSTTVLFVVTRI